MLKLIRNITQEREREREREREKAFCKMGLRKGYSLQKILPGSYRTISKNLESFLSLFNVFCILMSTIRCHS